jgi:hypothetical protein
MWYNSCSTDGIPKVGCALNANSLGNIIVCIQCDHLMQLASTQSATRCAVGDGEVGDQGGGQGGFQGGDQGPDGCCLPAVSSRCHVAEPDEGVAPLKAGGHDVRDDNAPTAEELAPRHLIAKVCVCVQPTWCACSQHGVHAANMVCMQPTWCACSQHGVHAANVTTCMQPM